MNHRNHFANVQRNKHWFHTAAKKWLPLPSNVEVVQGSIVNLECWGSKDDDKCIICQQNNCVAVRSHGLSETIYKAFPFANIYEERRLAQNGTNKRKLESIEDYMIDRPSKQKKLNKGKTSSRVIQHNTGYRGEPGTIILRQKDKTIISNMIAQYYTGKGDRFGNTDTSLQREKWFAKCLDELESFIKDDLRDQRISVTFPWKIGSGLAGGDWDKYLTMLMEFALRVSEVRVVLVSNN